MTASVDVVNGWGQMRLSSCKLGTKNMDCRSRMSSGPPQVPDSRGGFVMSRHASACRAGHSLGLVTEPHWFGWPASLGINLVPGCALRQARGSPRCLVVHFGTAFLSLTSMYALVRPQRGGRRMVDSVEPRRRDSST